MTGWSSASKTFGARGVVSSEDPQKISFDAADFRPDLGRLLFSHPHAPRWRDFLTLLESVLTPSGLLVFTTHGQHAAEQMRPHETDPEIFASYDQTGFGWAHREWKYPGQPDLGASISTLGWIQTFVEAETGLSVGQLAEERGWVEYQDVVSCTKRR